ncbi:MAG: DNA-processing protein DprA [Candidatus Aminicenantes bacterium]|nr:DNA-processing protein DprA [Candidatus Aminicenantes bacterium]
MGLGRKQKTLFGSRTDGPALWVALNLVLSDSLRSAQKVAARYPDPAMVFRASAEELQSLGVEKEKAAALTSRALFDRASETLSWLAHKGYFVLTIDDPGYPDALREVFDPPCVLYGAGRPEVLREPSIAVVGARRPTPYGRAVAEKLARDLAARGLVIVSGLARGIDSIAHWGALDSGRTVAVLGSGLDDIYPPENKGLFRKIAETGAVITEFPPRMPPLGFHFPLRNRIISGLSLATLVVEATRQSGSLITARLALEQNRDVMAVPGCLTSDLSRGTNWLIKSGAKLVESWEDVIEELPLPLRESLLAPRAEEKREVPAMSPEEKKVFDRLSVATLTHIDELVEAADSSVSEMLGLLLSLEIKGLVRQVPGKHFQRSL